MIVRLSVVSGSLRPFMPSAFGQKVEYGRGSLVSGSHRITPCPRVQPEFTTSFKSSLLTSDVSASSITNVGPHFSIDLKSAGPVMDTHSNAWRTRNPSSPSRVDLPLFASADVAS